MFCTRCGAQIDTHTKFCSHCGAPIEQIAEQPAAEVVYAPQEEEAVSYEEPAVSYEQPVAVMPVKSPHAAPTLVWGILGLSFACVPYVNFLGIIFSCISLGKAKKIGKPLPAVAKVGKGLATAGLIVGIILTIVFSILIAGIIFSVIEYGGDIFSDITYYL